MDAKPGSGEAPDASSPGAERCGPLELRRLRKEDGRQLIVYARAEPFGHDEGGSGPRPPAPGRE